MGGGQVRVRVRVRVRGGLEGEPKEGKKKGKEKEKETEKEGEGETGGEVSRSRSRGGLDPKEGLTRGSWRWGLSKGALLYVKSVGTLFTRHLKCVN